MKRSQMVSKIASAIINYRTPSNFTTREHALEVAETILTIQEKLGIIKPTKKVKVTLRDIELMPYEETVVVEGWEHE